MTKESFVLYTSQFAPVRNFSLEQLGMLFKMIFRYKLGEELDTCEDMAVNTAFLFFKNQLDMDNEKYLEKCSTLSENGKKGGNPNFKKGQSNPYYTEREIEGKEITKDNQTLPKISKDNLNENVNDNDNDNDNDNVNENVIVGSIGKKRTNVVFQRPTIEEIRAYILEKGYTYTDADKFFDFYESKNWYVGKNKMKDWKAAVRNWERTDKERSYNHSSSPKGTTIGQTIHDDRDVHKYDNTKKELGL